MTRSVPMPLSKKELMQAMQLEGYDVIGVREYGSTIAAFHWPSDVYSIKLEQEFVATIGHWRYIQIYIAATSRIQEFTVKLQDRSTTWYVYYRILTPTELLTLE